MTSRAEVTTRYAKVYAKVSKKDKGRILGEVVGVTRWSRDNARRRLTAAAKRTPGGGRQVAKKPRKPRSPKYSYDTVKVLQRVWAAWGGQCGKYLVASMRIQLDGLERHGELVDGVDRYSSAVGGELLAMSAASIDRYLKPAKAPDQIRGFSTTKPSLLLRSAMQDPTRAGQSSHATSFCWSCTPLPAPRFLHSSASLPNCSILPRRAPVGIRLETSGLGSTVRPRPPSLGAWRAAGFEGLHLPRRTELILGLSHV